MRALLLCLPLLLAATPDPLAVFDHLAGGVAGPDGAPLFPADLRVEPLGDGRVRLHGAFEHGDAVVRDLRVEALVGALAAAGFEAGLRVEVPDGEGGWRPLGGWAPHPAPIRAVGDPLGGALRPRSPQRPRPGGALAGRRIAISAGHGWIPTDAGGWRTQRVRWAFEGCGNCRGITEDFFTAEVVSRYVVPLLQGMGAEVVLVREPDHDARPAAVVDDGDPGYAEVGGPWVAGNSGGGYADDYRVLAPDVGGEASWAPGVRGLRRLALRYRHGGNREADAELEVVHAGGRAIHAIDQRREGWIWRDLGAYELDADSRVLLRHGGGEGVVIADAVKVGGGTHPDAGHPWWQMGALPYVRWAGAPAEVEAANDVTVRPLYAEHAGADLYLSIHANASGRAGGSSAHGLSTYRYSCQRYGDHSRAAAAVDCDEPPGSARLAELVHGAILEGVRADWDPAWRDGATRVANFGELRRLDDAPGVLVESGFFDNVVRPEGTDLRYADNRSLHDPRWREAFARGVATGIARYFDPAAEAPPVPPTGLWAHNRADGTLDLSWSAVPGASAYRVYVASHGRAWDDGVRIDAGTRWRTAGLTPRQVYSFRVAALDGNGEGRPSQAVTARFRGAALAEGVPAARALVIGAYDRRDAWVQGPDNDQQAAVEHGHGLAAAPELFFDGALDERVEAGDVPLAAYALVDLVVGKDATADDSVSAWMRGALSAHLATGGRLIVSGEEIGWDLVERSDDPAEAAWLADALGADYLSDDAEAFAITGVGPFADLGEVRFDDGTAGGYEVRYPDVLAAQAGAELAFVWPDGRGAAIASPSTIYFGAGLEALVGAEDRGRVFAAAVAHLLPERSTTPDLDLDGVDDACDPDPRDAADAHADPDGDGRDTATECAEGTDPGVADLDTDAGVLDGGPIEDAAAADAGVDATVDGGEPDGDVAVDDAGVERDGAVPPVDLGVDARGTDAAPDLGVIRFDGGERVATTQQSEGGCRAAPLSGPGPWAWLLLLLLGARGTRSAGRRRGRR